MNRIACLLFVASASCSENTLDQTESVSISDDELRAYARLNRMTETPHRVNAYVFMLCTGVSPEVASSLEEQYGPHAMTSVHIYMNDIAQQAILNEMDVYPVGSVIVKEKLLSIHDDPANVGVGGMIKREAGYNSDFGDWEYFYIDESLQMFRGSIQNCQSCHSTAGNDSVFASWY